MSPRFAVARGEHRPLMTGSRQQLCRKGFQWQHSDGAGNAFDGTDCERPRGVATACAQSPQAHSASRLAGRLFVHGSLVHERNSKMVQRMLMLMMQPSKYPDTPYVKYMAKKRINLCTFWQTFFLRSLCCAECSGDCHCLPLHDSAVHSWSAVLFIENL